MGNGVLDPTEISHFGEFMLGEDWHEEATESFFNRIDKNKDRSLTFQEFSNFCESVVLDDDSKDVLYVKQMIKGFLRMVDNRNLQTQAKWHYRARVIDLLCRFLVPPVFALSLIVVNTMSYDST